MRVKYTKILYFRVYICFCVNLVIFLGKMTKMVNNVHFLRDIGHFSGKDDVIGKQCAFLCDIGNLSGKDDENGKQCTVFV